MSVINQVLNELEKRGAHSSTQQPMVRAVYSRKRDFLFPVVAILLVLTAGIATWQWVLSRKFAAIEESVTTKVGSDLSHDETNPAVIPNKSSPSLTQVESAESAQVLQFDTLAPASKLSLELSPATLATAHRLPNQANDMQSSDKPSIGDKHKFSDVAQQKSVELLPATPSQPKSAANAIMGNSTSAVGTVPIKKVSVTQQADAEFRRAAGLMQMGRIAEAISGYEAALRLDAGHDTARQALVALLLEGKRNADAEKVLLEGLNNKPEHTGFTMLLARLQVERGALDQASATLEKSLSFAVAQSDYRAFFAALLQRQNRHEEAINNYQVALQNVPSNGAWLMGYGISLEALQRNAEAKNAFQRALATKTLSPELQSFVQQKLKGL